MEALRLNHSNFYFNGSPKDCDSSVDKRHLLLEAKELSYRAYITSECLIEKDSARRDMWLFEDTLETLSTFNTDTSMLHADRIIRALQRAYDVRSGHAEKRDRVYYDVSYGSVNFHSHSLNH